MEGILNINTAMVIELIKKIIIAILQKAGAFDELGDLGIDIETYIDQLFYTPEETGTTAP